MCIGARDAVTLLEVQPSEVAAGNGWKCAQERPDIIAAGEELWKNNRKTKAAGKTTHNKRSNQQKLDKAKVPISAERQSQNDRLQALTDCIRELTPLEYQVRCPGLGGFVNLRIMKGRGAV